MEVTRTNVIAKINDWLGDIDSRNIFWLKGSPGAGKSAISATMAAQLRAENRLGPYFFFESGHNTLGNPTSLCRTFSADLAMFHPYLRTKIVETLKELRVDPSVPDVKAHFQHLVREPLQSALQSLSEYPVFIIDGVDECATPEHRRMLLETLKRWAELPHQFKLLVTSRDYHDIATSLRSVSVNHVLRTGDLVDGNSSAEIEEIVTDSSLSCIDHLYSQNLDSAFGSPTLMNLSPQNSTLALLRLHLLILTFMDVTNLNSHLPLLLAQRHCL